MGQDYKLVILVQCNLWNTDFVLLKMIQFKVCIYNEVFLCALHSFWQQLINILCID